MPTRELAEARVALAHRQLTRLLLLLREAERVAVAQRKLEELLEVRKLVRTLSTLSGGQATAAIERLARTVDVQLAAFPADELAAAGADLGGELAVLASKLRALSGPPTSAVTRDLSRARAALDGGEVATALTFLQEARRVAVAQGRLGELLDVYELVQLLAERGDTRTRAASMRLAHETTADLRAAARAANVGY